MDDSLERVATTATGLDAEEDRGRVESSENDGLGEEDASKQGRILDIDSNEDIYLVNVHKDKDTFGVNDSDGDEVSAVDEVNTVRTTTTTTVAIDDITLAKALIEIKSQGQGKMVKPEPVKKLSKKDQLKLDEELAFKLQAKKEEEEERIAREKAQQIKEVNIAWDDVQAKIDADYELAQRLQAEEQKELTDAEKKKLFIPPTRAQQRTIVCTYLKNIDGWKLKSLKKKSFAEIQELFDKAMKKVNTFVDFKTELVEESSKKAEAKITQEDDGDDVTIDATHFSSKCPTIVDYKIYKEGMQNYFQIFKANEAKRKEVAGESSAPRKSLMKKKILFPCNDEEQDSYASDFHNSIFKDEEDTRTRIEPESHKEHPKIVDEDDNFVEKKMTDDKKDENDDHTNHVLVRSKVSGSLETRNKQMETPIPLPPRSSRIDLSLDKVLSQELTATVSQTPAITSQDTSKSKRISSNTDHDDHLEVDAPLEGEKRAKRHKSSKRLKSARGSSYKQPTTTSETYVFERQQQQEWDTWAEESVIDKMR
uniref:Uncharacterized protein n=1 Tax=Tanacetum cinerariifolium TaxID=118510 RepID=A0A6L2JQ21_TANCI|nr:hypothetical protein [Tanacetum cinerariifolium]